MGKRKKLKKDVRMKSLDPMFVPRNRKELLDADYLNKLSYEDKRWYAQFIDEWAGGNVRKRKDGKIRAGQLHDTPKLAKDCYDRNNKRNNDIFSIKKATGALDNIEDHLKDGQDAFYVNNPELVEQAMLKELDKEQEETLTIEEYKKLRKQMTEEMQTYYNKLFNMGKQAVKKTRLKKRNKKSAKNSK